MRKLFVAAVWLPLLLSSCLGIGSSEVAASIPTVPSTSSISSTGASIGLSSTATNMGSSIQSAYPLALGATWTYRAEISYQDSTGAASLSTWTGTITDQVISQETTAGDETTFTIQENFSPLPPQGVWRQPSVFHLQLTRNAVYKDGRETLAWPLTDGLSWEPAPDFGYEFTAASVPSVQTPLGQQEGCFQLALQTNPDALLDTFCPGIGFVEHSYQHHGTPQIEHFVLVAFTPGP